MTYSTAKFEVATSNGLGGDTFTRNVKDACMTDGRRTNFDMKLIYPFFLKEKASIKTWVGILKCTKIIYSVNTNQKYDISSIDRDV